MALDIRVSLWERTGDDSRLPNGLHVNAARASEGFGAVWEAADEALDGEVVEVPINRLKAYSAAPSVASDPASSVDVMPVISPMLAAPVAARLRC